MLTLIILYINEEHYGVVTDGEDAVLDGEFNRLFVGDVDDDFAGDEHGEKVGVAREDVKRADAVDGAEGLGRSFVVNREGRAGDDGEEGVSGGHGVVRELVGNCEAMFSIGVNEE